MRSLSGVGYEYGTEWAIKSILESELSPINLAEEFEESVRQCYTETTQVGWMTLDTVSVMRDQDRVSWACAQSEWESFEAEEGNILTVDGGSTSVGNFSKTKEILIWSQRSAKNVSN